MEEIPYQKLTKQEKRWFDKVMNRYDRGLVTKTERDTYISEIRYHHIDPTYPIHI